MKYIITFIVGAIIATATVTYAGGNWNEVFSTFDLPRAGGYKLMKYTADNGDRCYISFYNNTSELSCVK